MHAVGEERVRMRRPAYENLHRHQDNIDRRACIERGRPHGLTGTMILRRRWIKVMASHWTPNLSGATWREDDRTCLCFRPRAFASARCVASARSRVIRPRFATGRPLARHRHSVAIRNLFVIQQPGLSVDHARHSSSRHRRVSSSTTVAAWRGAMPWYANPAAATLPFARAPGSRRCVILYASLN
jgi:hypothetical protein